MKLVGRKICALLCLVLSAVTVAETSQDFPRRPINIITPYKAGGGVDSYARALAASARGMFEAPFVVINKPGAGGLNGSASTMRARPDGYTVLLVSGSSLVLSTQLRNSPVDALNSFKFIAKIGVINSSLMVPVNSPFKTISDVIDAAKQRPLRWGHSGRGSFHHVSGLGFLEKNHLQIQDVPFKGGAPARAALIGNQVDFGFIGVQQSRGFEKYIRVLAVNADQRDSAMNQVPTFSESNFLSFPLSSPVIMLAPKDTPDALIGQLTQMLREICHTSEYQQRLHKQGLSSVFQTGVEARYELEHISTDVKPFVESMGKKSNTPLR